MAESAKFHAFLGPVCDYAIAPVSRYAGVWGIPVLTTGGQADAFLHKGEHYPTLTRMMGSHRLVGEALRHILHSFGWTSAALIYHNHAMESSKGHSECHFTLSAVFSALNKTSVHKSFNQETNNFNDYRNLLTFVSHSARTTGPLPSLPSLSPSVWLELRFTSNLIARR
ncbi:Similar to Npr3: Atrial natriuretic peptide receptor 3 (Mus musculus) [Cotesia congregata]|uniref:Similar to Npr3: Atrial natriuretic peptide receptor 3 (Mus musculus) n=1 Tax=Cotesia congregata TaxID=51543 RepID=A0A8J2H915_COTCN|nr:Similar to Npr3: Atrial natriuretic peptide receptor 3 (Mus musculus) [Cotesia congregata]